MKELFSIAFFLGDWNFALSAEVNLGSWVFGVKFDPADHTALYEERQVAIHLPTFSIALTWIDDENLERKQAAYDLLYAPDEEEE